MTAREKIRIRRERLRRPLQSIVLAVATLLLSAAALPTAATAAPELNIEATSNSSAEPGEQITFLVQLHNHGDVSTPVGANNECTIQGPGCYAITAEAPPGLLFIAGLPLGTGGLPCSTGGGGTTITCNNPGGAASNRQIGPLGSSNGVKVATLFALVLPGTDGPLTTSFSAYGGGATLPDGGSCASAANPPPGQVPCDTTSVTTDATDEEPSFGVDVFDGQVASNALGDPYTQAGGTPFRASNQLMFEAADDPQLEGTLPGAEIGNAVDPPKDIVVDLPAGLIGNPTVAPTCSFVDFVGGGSFGTNCNPATQVGTVTLHSNQLNSITYPHLPVFSLSPPTDAPARFAFKFFDTIVTLDALVRSDSDSGVSLVARNTPQGLSFRGTDVELWGVPAAPSHDRWRACPGAPTVHVSGQTIDDCPDAWERPLEQALLRLPTSCVGPVETNVAVSSWDDPGAYKSDGSPDLSDPNWQQDSFTSHNPPAYPLPEDQWGGPQGVTNCNAVPFNPHISVEATSSEADSPTGLAVDIAIPQSTDPGVLGSSDLKDTTVTLPEGFSLNPSAADGLESCTLEEIDLEGRNTEPECPNASKIGTTTIDTPLLEDPLDGSVYLAEQNDPSKPGAENPFDTLTAYYIVAEGPGTVIKLPGKVELDENTGQIVNTFTDNPQLPFNNFHVEFFDGPRSPIATPQTCMSGDFEAELTPWARPDEPVTRTDGLEITSMPGGEPCVEDPADRSFNPDMKSGVTSPVAGSATPFIFQLTREDGDQEILSTTVNPPQGLTAKLAGIPYCSEADIAAVSCPAESKIGSELAGAGAGSNPFYTSANPGSVYLAGPYKGAPLSMVIQEPVIAGPFDLDDISVRAAIHVDPRTAQLTVISDEIPQINSGIPLRIRDLRIRMDRPDFTIAPTNCDPMSVNATVQGAHGAEANLTNHFQVGECGNLGFNPKLRLNFGKSKKNTKRNAHPELKAKLAFNEGDANISSVQVALPEGVFLDQERIGKVCSREAYAAESCPAASQVGHAKATTPLLDQPVEGPVYLKASDNVLPDLAADLNGQIDIDLFGRIDQREGKRVSRIQNTFDVVPDVPVADFELTLAGGKDGLLVNSKNICKSKRSQKVSIDMQAHNEMSLSENPLIGSACKQINKKKAKKLKKKAKRLQRKAKKASSKKKAKKLRKQARKLKRQARKLGR